MYQQTSREAYAVPQPTLDEQIVESLGIAPMTCNEIELRINRKHQAVSGNLRHLVERGIVEASGEYGITQYGKRAIKWRRV
jgi:predicted transcriptional regulator